MYNAILKTDNSSPAALSAMLRALAHAHASYGTGLK